MEGDLHRMAAKQKTSLYQISVTTPIKQQAGGVKAITYPPPPPPPSAGLPDNTFRPVFNSTQSAWGEFFMRIQCSQSEKRQSNIKLHPWKKRVIDSKNENNL